MPRAMIRRCATSEAGGAACLTRRMIGLEVRLAQALMRLKSATISVMTFFASPKTIMVLSR